MGLAVVTSAYAAALATLGVAATYTPAGGGPATVRAFLAAHDPPIDLDGVQVRPTSPGYRLLLLVSEVAAQPTRGATVTIGADTYTMQAAAQRSGHPGLWLCDAVKE
jgi:hypothetical protein